MTFGMNNEWLALEFELQTIQNEIDRRHNRVNQDFQRARNLDKIKQLREERNKISEKLAALS